MLGVVAQAQLCPPLTHRTDLCAARDSRQRSSEKKVGSGSSGWRAHACMDAGLEALEASMKAGFDDFNRARLVDVGAGLGSVSDFVLLASLVLLRLGSVACIPTFSIFDFDIGECRSGAEPFDGSLNVP
eukprot:3036472-Pyramimonas_sp.AAC.1